MPSGPTEKINGRGGKGGGWARREKREVRAGKGGGQAGTENISGRDGMIGGWDAGMQKTPGREGKRGCWLFCTEGGDIVTVGGREHSDHSMMEGGHWLCEARDD